jgi:hypothetical protein
MGGHESKRHPQEKIATGFSFEAAKQDNDRVARLD